MGLQVTFLVCAMRTEGAMEGFISPVDHQVALEVPFLPDPVELLATEVTAVLLTVLIIG